MDIKTIVLYLNKTKGYNIDPDYYAHIKMWQDWWRGFHKPFHEFNEVNGTNSKKRKLYTLKMAKKVCEDWASILLNEKTEVVIGDEASSKFLMGDDGKGGVFGSTVFWDQGNALIEKAFYSGTGAFVVKLAGMILMGEEVKQDSKTKIRLDYLSAMNIIPLTVRQGRTLEVAFVSEVLEKGDTYIYIETHELDNGTYKITNQYFQYKNEQIQEVPLPSGIAPIVRTGSDIPLFAIVMPNIVNTYENSNGLGMSVYANAVDVLMGVDLAYNNFNRDFKLGGKKVFYNSSIIQHDEKGNPIAPDDVMQQLFVQVADEFVGEDGKQKAVQEFNPSLRVAENREGVQSQLDFLSFKCGLGTKHYQFNSGSVVTATQYTGDKQDLVQNAAKHYIPVQTAIKDIARAILWAGKEVLGEPVNPDASVTVNFEDSYIIDKESERIRDMQEVREGLQQKWEYRVKWYGEEEAEAKKMVGANLTDDQNMGF